MSTTNPIQSDLDAWDGIGYPPSRATIQQQPGYQALPPADKITALNTAQRMVANRIRTDDPAGYGDIIRDVETDFQKTRQEEIETHLATDLAEGKFTDQQVKDYTAGRVSLMDYPEQKDLAGPWVTNKFPITGSDGKPQGYAYIRHDPSLTAESLDAGIGTSTDPRLPSAVWKGGNDRAEVSWVINGKGEKISGVEDVGVGEHTAMVARSRALLQDYATRQARSTGGAQEFQEPEPPAELVDRVAQFDTMPAALRPAMAAVQAFSALAQKRPEISDKIGQGFWQGLPGEAAKGFLSLGNAAVNAGPALFGSRDAVDAYQQGQADINADFEGQSRLGFRGALTDKVLQGLSSEAVPMIFSAGTGAVAAAARKALTSAVGKTFLSRMAALEMEQAAKQGLNLTAENAAKVIAGELTGEGVGTTMRQGLATSLARGYMGKWIGTAEIEGPLARQLADRVSNAVAFLPSSARGALDNMAVTLNKAAELRAAGKEDEAKALEGNAVLNGWAGLGIEVLSENMWLNEFMVTRAGRSLASVSSDVLERTLRPGLMAKLAERGKAFLKAAAVQGNQEGVEEIASGISGRAWMNEFAAQNQDLLSQVAPEYFTGAALGALLSGAKAMAADGQPAALRELITRGIDGDAGALAALARIRTRADAIASQKALAAAANNPPGTDATLSSSPPPAVVAGAAESGAVPGAPVPGRLANIAGSVPPPIVTGDATEAPAGTMDNTLVPPAPADVAEAPPPEGIDPSLVEPPPADAAPVKAAPPDTLSPEGAVALPDSTAQDTSSNPELVSPAVNNPDPMVATASPAAPGETTFPEDTTVPAGVPAPKTASPAAIQPPAPAPPNAPGETLATEYAALQAELDSKGVAAKVATLRAKGTTAFAGRVGKIVQRMREIEALTPAAPESTVPTSPPPAAQPAAVQGAGRRGKAGQPPAPAPGPSAEEGKPTRKRKSGPRFQKDPETHPIISALIGAGVQPPPPHRHLAAWRKQQGMRTSEADRAALRSRGEFDDMPTVSQYKGRPRAQDAIRQMYRAGSRNTVDQAFQEALGQSDEALVERVRRLHTELQSLDGQTATADPNEADYTEEERQNGEFYAAIQGGMIRLASGDLKKGDVLNIEGEQVTVARVNMGRDGTVESVVLQDGRRFGRQTVEADVALFVEGYDPADGPPVTATDRSGKPLDPYRGDFLADTADEPFNLVAETADERRAREARQLRDQKAAEAKAAEERARQAERDQIQMFPDESDEDMNPFSRAAGIDPDHLTGVPAKAATDALGALRLSAPELARNVRLVQNPAQLDPADYSPTTWTAINDPQVEGFYNAKTGETIILTDHITRRPGETAIGATARVILHERLAHAGLAILRASDPAFAKEWKALTDAIPVEELLALLPAYPHLRDSPELLAEEWFARQAEAAKSAPEGSLLRRMWEALKRALLKVWHRLQPGGMTLNDRVAEMLYQSRKALRRNNSMSADQQDRGITFSREDIFSEPRPMFSGKPTATGIRQTIADVEAWLGRVIQWANGRPSNKPVVLEDGPDRAAVVLPSVDIDEQGLWRTTRFVKFADGEWKPTGHMVFPSREAAIRDALTKDGFKRVSNLAFSRNPLERRDWQSVPLPQWAKNKLGARAVAPFEVRSQEARAILTGSPMPREFARIAAQTQEEIKAVQDRGAAIAADLQAAMKAYAKRTGTDLQRVSDDINTALEDPAMMAAIADPVLKTRALAARNFVDVLSDEVANTTGGQLGKTIRQNAGHWLRRSYAAFDDSAGWDATTLREAARAGKQLAGRDARTILANARAYLLTQFPGTPPLGIEVMISDLTNRDAWQSATFGIPRADGSRVSREVSSFMQRQTIAPEIRALMGEERNPIKRLSRSIGIQAQLIARFDQQRAMRDLGLAMGVFSTTADATYHRPVGGTDVHGNMRWNGFAITDPTTGKSQPVYTTPEMEAALNAASAVDGKNLGGVILRAYKALGTEAKLNRVALNPDSWAVNIFGNVLGMVQSGDMFHFAGWQRIAEAVRLHASSREMSGDAVNAVAEAIREQQRALVGRMAAAGVAGASFDMRDLEASIDQATLAFIQGTPLRNIAAGATRGAIAGQAFGKAAGSVGQAIGGAVGAVAGGIAGGRRITAAQRAIAQAVLSAPDNIGKIAVFLGNYATGKSAGMADQAAFDLAAEKTRNTMPDYSKLPALLRETSKLGIMGSFIAFQWEVYRNYYHNIRYAFQELKSGNAAMVARGLRRMLGAATVTALGSGLVAAIAGAGGDDKDEAYRRALGAPWERFSKLAYTKLDKEEASFFNTSYLIPQTSLFEIFRAASEGKSFEDGLANALTAARRQFAGGSVHGDPILEAIMNTKTAGGKVTYEEGWTGFGERLAHILRVTNEPGAANKAERIGKAIRGEELRGRKFSLQEELLRALGIRQGTYRHEDRIRGKLYTIREAYSDARAAANKAWRDTPMERDSAIARANERIAAVEKDFGELQADLQTIGIPKSKVEAIRKEVKLGVNFHRLKAGKDGPESIIK